MACNCQDSKMSNEDARAAFAERSARLATALPDDVASREKFGPATGEFLSALRDTAAGYALARDWSEREARQRFEAFRLADAALSYGLELAASVAKAAPGGTGGGGLSCTARCTSEKESCRQDCNAADGGYFCYFDCRLSYMACLASCITGGGGDKLFIA
jgi:hypothetical protein